MIIEAVIIGTIISFIMKGNFNNINNFSLNNFHLMGIGVILSILTHLFTRVDLGIITYYSVNYYYILHIISLILISIGFLTNYEYKSLMGIGIGFILNIFPIAINGKMPVNLNALLQTANSKTIDIITNGRSLSHGVFENPKLEFLSDIFAIKPPYPIPKVVSIGDIVITVCIVTFIVTLTRRNNGIYR